MDRLLAAAIGVVLLVRVLTALPLDATIPGGTDTASHLFKSWTFSQGFSWWSHDWYCGFNLFSHYPPLFHILVATFTGLLGHILAYKFVIDAVYVLTPLAFLVLLRRLGLSATQQAAGLLVFSLLPVHAYYLYDGRHPAMLAMTFIILYAAAALSKHKAALPAAGLFLGLAILSHHLTAAFGFAVTLPLLWQNRRKVVTATFIGLLVAAVWLLPFVLESAYKPASQGLIGGRPLEVAAEIVGASYLSTLANPWAQPFVILELLLLSGALLSILWPPSAALTAIKSRGAAFASLAVVGAIYMLISYKRVLLLAVIPVALLLAYQASGRRWRWLVFAAIALMIVPITHPLTVVAPQLPDSGLAGRTLFLGALPGAGYMEAYLLPISGHPYALGWHPESQTTSKSLFNAAIAAPEKFNDTAYADLLRRGWIGTVLVPVNSSLYERFSSSATFRLLNSSDGITAFTPIPAPSFLDLDGRPVVADVKFGFDLLTADFACSPGLLTIKESWSPAAELSLNGQTLVSAENNDGFVQARINQTGQCRIEMRWNWV